LDPVRITDPVNDTDDKYIVFRKPEALLVSDGFITFKVDSVVPDAVVIRRQDLFASPALASYAASIAIAIRVAESHQDMALVSQLLRVADYFQRQSELAADEGWKLPDV